MILCDIILYWVVLTCILFYYIYYIMLCYVHVMLQYTVLFLSLLTLLLLLLSFSALPDWHSRGCLWCMSVVWLHLHLMLLALYLWHGTHLFQVCAWWVRVHSPSEGLNQLAYVLRIVVMIVRIQFRPRLGGTIAVWDGNRSQCMPVRDGQETGVKSSLHTQQKSISSTGKQQEGILRTCYFVVSDVSGGVGLHYTISACMPLYASWGRPQSLVLGASCHLWEDVSRISWTLKLKSWKVSKCGSWVLQVLARNPRAATTIVQEGALPALAAAAGEGLSDRARLNAAKVTHATTLVSSVFP